MEETTMEKTALELANAEAASRKSKIARMKRQLEEFQEKLSAVEQERDGLKTQYQQELEAAQGKVRDLSHKSAFERVAKGLGANETAINDLWSVSGYKPEADDVDEEKLKNTVAETLKAKPYFLASPTQQKLAAGPGLARGATSQPGFTVRRSELREIANGPRKKEFVEASKANNVTIIED